VHGASLAISKSKADLVKSVLESSGFGGGLGAHVGVSVCYAIAAALVVLTIAPAAYGSGMAAVLLLLNGTHLSGAFTPQTLVAKMVGLILTSGSGLAAGQVRAPALPAAPRALRPSRGAPAGSRCGGLWREAALGLDSVARRREERG
jgi:H+/Cl- antiporter ClcA